MPKSSADKTEKILDRYLDSDFSCFACGDDVPSAKELTDLGQELGIQFPDEFITYTTSNLGGLYIAVKEDIWPRPKPYDVGPFWSFLYGLWVYGLGPEIPDWMNLAQAAKNFIEETGRQVAPFLKIIGDADAYCFDAAGNIVRWRHEENGFEGINKSFYQLLEDEVRELKERKEKKKAGA